MAYSPISNQQLGLLLQISFSEGVRTQISQDYRDWEVVKRARIGDFNGREHRFSFLSSFGPAAVQYRNPNFSANFPAAQQITTSEHTAVCKEIDVTVELEYNLWKMAQQSPAKYAEPLALEIQSKTYAAKRRMAADLYGDGTGVVGQLAASGAAVSSPASNVVEFTLSALTGARGHVGFFEYGDILILRTQAGGATALETNLTTEPANWKVVSKNRKTNKVKLQALDANLSPTAAITTISVQPETSAVFYRYGQPTIPDLTASIADYGTVTEVIAGLESLTANDGRKIHGITMEGAAAGTRLSGGGAALDVSMIQELMSNVKVNVGQSTYKWSQLVMCPEANDSLIESRETDRRFQSVEDNKRGVKVFAYVHGNDVLECVTSEYCPKQRIYAQPEGKMEGHKVLEYHGTDFEPVKADGGSPFNLKPSSAGGFERRIVSYMEGRGVLISNHSAAVGVLEDFSL